MNIPNRRARRARSLACLVWRISMLLKSDLSTRVYFGGYVSFARGLCSLLR